MYDHPPYRETFTYPFASVTAMVNGKHSSPLPHISTFFPHHHDSPYSPNTKASDISRLLDPAYHSANSSSSGTSSPHSTGPSAQPRAYVDHNGDLHDPDYRDFPILRPTRQKSGPQRRRTSGSSSSRPNRYSSAYANVVRPEWERDWAAEVDDEDEEVQEVDFRSELDQRVSQYTSSSSSRTRTSRGASLQSSVYSPTSFIFAEPMTMSITSSPVESLEEQDETEEHQGSPVESVERSSRCRPSSLLRKAKRRSSQASVPALETRPQDKDECEDPATQEECTPQPRDEDQAPSCSAALRMQWQALNLRLSFGVFHIKQRLSSRRRKST